jgi:hypothetical protein
MSDLAGQEGELRMTVSITRAATGAVEEYELVGKCTQEEFDALTNPETEE